MFPKLLSILLVILAAVAHIPPLTKPAMGSVVDPSGLEIRYDNAVPGPGGYGNNFDDGLGVRFTSPYGGTAQLTGTIIYFVPKKEGDVKTFTLRVEDASHNVLANFLVSYTVRNEWVGASGFEGRATIVYVDLKSYQIGVSGDFYIFAINQQCLYLDTSQVGSWRNYYYDGRGNYVQYEKYATTPPGQYGNLMIRAYVVPSGVFPSLAVTLTNPSDGSILISSPIELKVRVTSDTSTVQDATVKFYADGNLISTRLSDSNGYATYQYYLPSAKKYTWYATVEKNLYNPDTSPTWAFTYNQGAWSLLDGPTPDASALASSTPRLYLAARGMDNGIWYRSMDSSGTWSGWIRVPGFTDVRPAIAVFNSRLYFVCKQLGANSIWFGYYPLTAGVVSDAFSGWLPLDGPTPSAVSVGAASDYSDYLYLSARGMDGSIWHRRMDTAESWSAWSPNPGLTDVSPAIAVYNNRLYFACKQNGTSSIWYGYVDLSTYPTAWSGWNPLSGLTLDSLTLATSGPSGYLYLAARGTDNGVWFQVMDLTGRWSGWVWGSGYTESAVGLTVHGAYLYLAARQAGTSNNLWIYR